MCGGHAVMSVQEYVGLCLFVCTHGSRDRRCGTVGPPLIDALRGLIKQYGLEDDVNVLHASHVGGHKVCQQPEHSSVVGGTC